MKFQDFIVGALAIIALCGIIVLNILSYDTQVLVPILTTLVGYLIGGRKEQIGAFLGGKKLGHKK